MYNHIRTLLRNRRPGDSSLLLAELVPEDYVPVTLPAGPAQVWSALFGSDPDLAYLDQRLHQLLTLLHSGPLAEHLLHHDSRITYDPSRQLDAEQLASRFGLTVLPDSPALLLVGSLRADESRGRADHSWALSIKDDLLTIRQQAPDTSSNSRAVEVVSGYDASYALQRELFVRAPYTEESWLVSGTARARRGVGDIVSSLRRAESSLAELLSGGEPYQSFRNCWYNHPLLSQRLAAAALALAYRMHELRGG